MKKKLLTPNNIYIAIILLLILIIISCYKCREYFTEHYDISQLTLRVYVKNDIENTSTKKRLDTLKAVQNKYNEYINSNIFNIPSVKYEQDYLNDTYTTPTFVLSNNTETLRTYTPTTSISDDTEKLIEIIKKNSTLNAKLTLMNLNNDTNNNYNKIFTEIQQKYKKYVDTHTKGIKIMNIIYETITTSDTSEQPYFVFTDTNNISTDIKPKGDKKVDQILDILKEKDNI